MKEVNNRIPLYPNRKKITFEDDGEERYAIVEYADEPLDEGTRIDKALFDSIKGDLYRIDKYTMPEYSWGINRETSQQTGAYIGLWGNSHYEKYGITVYANGEEEENYAYNAMNGVPRILGL